MTWRRFGKGTTVLTWWWDPVLEVQARFTIGQKNGNLALRRWWSFVVWGLKNYRKCMIFHMGCCWNAFSLKDQFSVAPISLSLRKGEVWGFAIWVVATNKCVCSIIDLLVICPCDSVGKAEPGAEVQDSGTAIKDRSFFRSQQGIAWIGNLVNLLQCLLSWGLLLSSLFCYDLLLLQ